MKQSLQVLDLPIDRVESELVVVPFFVDQRPLLGPAALLDWRLDGMLTSQLVEGHARGIPGDRYLVKANHKIAAEWIMFVGCGASSHGDDASVEKVVRELLSSITQAGFKQVGIGLPVETLERGALWQAALERELRSLAGSRLECQLAACDPSAYRN